MKEYIALPGQWRDDPDNISKLIEKSLAWAEALPEKLPRKKPSKGAKQW